jgi:hypothetical protein
VTCRGGSTAAGCLCRIVERSHVYIPDRAAPLHAVLVTPGARGSLAIGETRAQSESKGLNTGRDFAGTVIRGALNGKGPRRMPVWSALSIAVLGLRRLWCRRRRWRSCQTR